MISPIKGTHANHEVVYTERCVYSRRVLGMSDDVSFQVEEYGETDEIYESWFYCNDCDELVAAEELGGLPEEWYVYYNSVLVPTRARKIL